MATRFADLSDKHGQALRLRHNKTDALTVQTGGITSQEISALEDEAWQAIDPQVLLGRQGRHFLLERWTKNGQDIPDLARENPWQLLKTLGMGRKTLRNLANFFSTRDPAYVDALIDHIRSNLYEVQLLLDLLKGKRVKRKRHIKNDLRDLSEQAQRILG